MSEVKKTDVNIFERHPRVTIVCFCLAAIVIIDVLSANIYRCVTGFSWGWKVTEGFIEKFERTYRIASNIYHHDLASKRFVQGTFWGPIKYDLYTNSLGFKDKSARDISLIPDKRRIVFIGDSFTEGLGFPYEQTFVGLIDTALAQGGKEVLNAGVSSYSPVIYWRKVKYLIENAGLKFDELVVFLDICDVGNEVHDYRLNERGNVIDRELLIDRFKTDLSNNTILIYSVLHEINHRFFLQKEDLPDEEVVPQGSVWSSGDIKDWDYSWSAWTFDHKLYQKFGRQGLREMLISMDKLYVLLKKHNIKLTVAVYPWPVQVMYDDLDSVQVRFWRGWCKKHEVDFINVFPAFITGKTESERRQIVGKYYIKGDVHWNAEGHKLVAEKFLSVYEKK